MVAVIMRVDHVLDVPRLHAVISQRLRELRYADLVEYADGRRRFGGGRWLPYEFRSVEQLRYDFERDVRDVQAS